MGVSLAGLPCGCGAVSSLSLDNGKIQTGQVSGGGTIEVGDVQFATDAESGAVAWQAVDRRGGTTSAAGDTLDTWLDVHQAFEAWSKQFVGRLPQLGICKG